METSDRARLERLIQLAFGKRFWRIILTISAIEALRRNMLYRMFKSVGEEDMDAMVAAQVEKAKGGDTKAFKEMKDMFMAGQPSAATSVSVSNSFNVEGGVIDAIVKIRESIAHLIRHLNAPARNFLEEPARLVAEVE